MGGDAYGAPAVWHSEQTSTTTEGYYYLFRDYLGSILAITDSAGVIQEKRIFDAWGEIAILQDGAGNNLSSFTLLDRGYTGHEHLLGVGLVHMNGRLYDPKLHRFLMPDNFVQDPYNTQNFNRYGYVLNNPLSYTDPSGESFFSVLGNTIYGLFKIGAVTAAAAYSISSLFTGNWNWKGFGMSALGGAIAGAITVVSFGFVPPVMTLGSIVSSIVMGVVAGLLPSANFSVGNWNFSVSPSIAFGNGFGAGANFSVSFSDGNFSASVGYGGWEYRKSWGANWDDGKNGFGLYSTTFSGLGGRFDQKVGGFSYRNGDFGFRYENDGATLLGKYTSGDTDMFRTNAFEVSYREFSLRGNLFTGKSGADESNTMFSNAINDPSLVDFSQGYGYGTWINPSANKYRLGALSFGYRGYRLGANSEQIRDFFQNRLAHTWTPGKHQPIYKVLSNEWKPYFQYQSSNRYTLW